jgi:phage terminase large subunit-like protein
VRFLENLTCGSGGYLGRPLVLRPWQRGIVTRLFGTLLPDGRRQYRRCYIWIPRKNGKTELAAALALYALIADHEPGAQIYSAAADRANAALIFHAAANMIKADPELSSVCEVIESRKEIKFGQSFYRALSSEAYSKHGLNAHAIIYDELHAAPDRDLWDVLTTSQGSRRQPLVVVISTAGYDRASIGYEVYHYTRQVRDGVVDDPSVLPVIYEAPDDADWTDERVWAAANPALGDFRDIDELRLQCREALAIPGNQNRFRQLYLNQWTEQHTRWLDLLTWDGQAGTVAPLDGRVVCGGLDLASVSDLSALAWVAEGEDGGLDVEVRCWVPDAQLERARNPKGWERYRQWVDRGFLTVTPGNATDYSFIHEAVLKDCARFDVRRLHMDRLFQGQQFMQGLAEEGVPVAPMGQGFLSMGPAVKAFEKRYLEGQIRHGGHPILRWMSDNVVVEVDPYEAIKPSKKRSVDRIDGIAALVTALERASAEEAPATVEFISFES